MGGLILRETGKGVGEFARVGFFLGLGEERELLVTHNDDEDTYPCERYDVEEKRYIITII